MKFIRFLPLLCLASFTSAQTYYNKTTIASPNSLSNSFDVMTYGAKCDGVTDDTTAVAATIAAAKTRYNAATYNNIKILFPPKAQCMVAAELDFTGFTNTSNHVVVEGQGAWIHWTNTGNALIGEHHLEQPQSSGQCHLQRHPDRAHGLIDYLCWADGVR
jgi:hypothetical protein